MNMHAMVIFTRKGGKILTTMTGYSSAMMSLYLVQNGLSKSRDAIIFDLVDGHIVKYYEGAEDKFPKEQKDMLVYNIDELCFGLLDAMREEEKESLTV